MTVSEASMANLTTIIQALHTVTGEFYRGEIVALSGKSVSAVKSFFRSQKQNNTMTYCPVQKKNFMLDEIDEARFTTNEALSFIHSSQVVFGQTVLPYLDASIMLEPNLDYPVVQRLCLALKKGRQIHCKYFSKTKGLRSHHLSPHSLVKIDSRYHLRAYSHDYDVWGDYVLSRFADADILSDAIIPADQDKDWNTSVELRFQLNPALDEATKSTIRWEWYLKESEAFVTITTRKALQNYAVRQMTRPDYQALKPLFIFQE